MTPSVPFAGVEPRLPPVLDIAQMTLLSPKLRIGPNWIGAERQPWRASGSQRFGRFRGGVSKICVRRYSSRGFRKPARIYSVFLISLLWSHLEVSARHLEPERLRPFAPRSAGVIW